MLNEVNAYIYFAKTGFCTDSRSNGMLKPGLVILSQFNHVIVAVRIDEDMYALDCTDPYCPYYLLPPNTLNGKGLVLNEENFDWIDLYSDVPYKEELFCEFSINQDHEFVGKVQ
ncbi:hypothetical protein ES705_37926 [subsurface metagenome]